MTVRRRLFREEEPEWLVWLTVLILLAIGLIAKTVVVNQTTTFSQDNLSVTYPADWTPIASNAPDTVLSVGESFGGGLFPARLAVRQLLAADVSRSAQSLGDLALEWSDDQAKDLLAYRVLDIEPVQVRGKDAVRVDYAYVAEPAFAAPDALPIVARGSDYLIRQGETLTVVQLLAASDAFDGLSSTWDRITGSVEMK
jgi:hypothetical protein